MGPVGLVRCWDLIACFCSGCSDLFLAHEIRGYTSTTIRQEMIGFSVSGGSVIRTPLGRGIGMALSYKRSVEGRGIFVSDFVVTPRFAFDLNVSSLF